MEQGNISSFSTWRKKIKINAISYLKKKVKINVISYLDVWWNISEKAPGPEVFF